MNSMELPIPASIALINNFECKPVGSKACRSDQVSDVPCESRQPAPHRIKEAKMAYRTNKADRKSVCPKSSPFQSIGSRFSRASA